MEPEDSDVVLSERYDRSSGVPMSAFVVRLVAVASDVRPIDLDPLGRYVDADSLDRLFDPTFPDGAHASLSVTFAYGGYTVEVASDVTVRLLEDPD